MASGLETYDASGNPLLSITDRIGGVLGVASTGINNGSISHAAFSNGTPFFAALNPGIAPLFLPTWSNSGGVLSWTFATPGSSSNQNVLFVYGVY